MAFGDILDVVLSIFFWAIIINALLSWVNPNPHNPITEILYLMTEPLLRIVRRFIPLIAGIDISPIPVLIVLHLCSILIAQPLLIIGGNMAIL